MSSKPTYFLGVDGGGTSCRVRIRDNLGRVRGDADDGPSNIHQKLDKAVATIISTARKAAKSAGLEIEILHAGLGLAGFVPSADAKKNVAAKLPFASVTVDNDAYAACIGAYSGGDGGVVIAGTGSIGFALVEGERHSVGGWGFTLGDHGSGAWLGHRAVRDALLAADGLLPPTRLIEEIWLHTGRMSPDILRWSEQKVPKDYADFAPLVFECATAGDVQGKKFVTEGAAAISNLGRALLTRGAERLCLLGGLNVVYPLYLDTDVTSVLVTPDADAVDGAIMMARKARGLPESWK